MSILVSIWWFFTFLWRCVDRVFQCLWCPGLRVLWASVLAAVRSSNGMVLDSDSSKEPKTFSMNWSVYLCYAQVSQCLYINISALVLRYIVNKFEIVVILHLLYWPSVWGWYGIVVSCLTHKNSTRLQWTLTQQHLIITKQLAFYTVRYNAVFEKKG